jgi:hypothetical protein
VSPPEELLVTARARGRRIGRRFREVLASTTAELVGAYARPDVDAAALAAIIGAGARELHLAGVDLLVEVGATGLEPVVIELNGTPAFAHTTPGLDAWEHAYLPFVDLLLGKVPRADWPDVALLSRREPKIPIHDTGLALALAARTGRPTWCLDEHALARAERRPGAGGTGVHVGGRRLSGALVRLGALAWKLLPDDVAGTFINSGRVARRGGRNKLAAQWAFERWNAEHAGDGLRVPIPRGRIARTLGEVEAARRELGGAVVTKVPHLNSARGIDFVARDQPTPALRLPVLVQELLEPAGLATARIDGGRHVFDLRVVVASDQRGFRPLMLRSRRAARPIEALGGPGDLRDCLVVNTSIYEGSRCVGQDTERNILIDDDGWATLGLSAHDWRRVIVIAMLATAAVDRHGRDGGEIPDDDD